MDSAAMHVRPMHFLVLPTKNTDMMLRDGTCNHENRAQWKMEPKTGWNFNP